jgi:four helix bundle protein
MDPRSFRNLRVWQAAVELAEHVYVVTSGFPRAETYGLTGQMRRAAISVASNIAEGQGRQHIREFLRFIAIARASLGELETQAEIARRVRYLRASDFDGLVGEIESVGRQLYGLRNALDGRVTNHEPRTTNHQPPTTTHDPRPTTHER